MILAAVNGVISTGIIGLIVIGAAALAARGVWKNKKKGCGCGCGGCSSACACKEEKKEEPPL